MNKRKSLLYYFWCWYTWFCSRKYIRNNLQMLPQFDTWFKNFNYMITLVFYSYHTHTHVHTHIRTHTRVRRIPPPHASTSLAHPFINPANTPRAPIPLCWNPNTLTNHPSNEYTRNWFVINVFLVKGNKKMNASCFNVSLVQSELEVFYFILSLNVTTNSSTQQTIFLTKHDSVFLCSLSIYNRLLPTRQED